MRCSRCQAEWTAPPGASGRLTHCPFCGASLVKRRIIDPTWLALQKIYQRLGNDGMRDANRVLDTFLDYAPSKRKEAMLLAEFLRYGGHTTLLDAAEGNADYDAALRSVIAGMMETNPDKSACTNICLGFSYAIGCLVPADDEPAPAVQPGAAIRPDPAPDRPTASSGIGQDSGDERLLYHVASGILIRYYGLEAHAVVPTGVETIGDQAFAGCANLQTVTIPASVCTIGERAFAGCANLRSVAGMQGVGRIKENAFAGCGGLRSVQDPERLLDCSKVSIEAGNECLERAVVRGLPRWQVIDTLIRRLTNRNLGIRLNNPLLVSGQTGFDEKYRMAQNAFAGPAKPGERPILVVGASIFSMGTKGYVLTSERICWHTFADTDSRLHTDDWSFGWGPDGYVSIRLPNDPTAHGATVAPSGKDAEYVADTLNETCKWLCRIQEVQG